jgi:hypothetical protein
VLESRAVECGELIAVNGWCADIVLLNRPAELIVLSSVPGSGLRYGISPNSLESVRNVFTCRPMKTSNSGPAIQNCPK